MRSFGRLAWHAGLLLATCLLAACANSRSCGSGSAPFVQDRLYFGLTTPAGPVADGDWTRFIETVVTPLFPQGFTVIEAQGQWRDKTGAIGHEPTRILDIVHGDDVESDRAIIDLAAAYKRRFRQESVLRVTTPACAAF